MKLAILRVSGTDWSPEEEFQNMSIEPEGIWHVGEKSRLGKIQSDSGAFCTVIDAASMSELLDTIRAFSAKYGKGCRL